MATANREDDAQYFNSLGDDFRVYVGFGNEVRIQTDARLVTPPVTEYPQPLGKVPDRPCAVLGPNRITFVGEETRFYGSRSYYRTRIPAEGHTWRAFFNGVEVTENDDFIVITTGIDTVQTFRGDPPQSVASIYFLYPGIYELWMDVENPVAHSHHTAKRQVIVYQDRDTAYAGVIEIGQISGSTSQGGFSTSLRVAGDMSFLSAASEIEGYIPVVIKVEQFVEVYNAELSAELGYPVVTAQQIDIGPKWHIDAYIDDPTIIFSGYIDRATITIDAESHTAQFECRTADMILEQMQTHVVGFFESAGDGKGVTFNDLTFHDVIRYMLQEKSNFADYVDLRLQYNTGYVPGSDTNNQVPNMEYKDWTFNQGQYWSNIRDGAQNEFSMAYCSSQGQIFVHPDRNMWHPQIWTDLNDQNSWNGSSWDGPTDYGYTIAYVPIGPEIDPLGIISDRKDVTAYPGTDSGAPVHVPLTIKVTERLSAIPSYYKITGNLSFWNEEWGADYPQQATDAANGRWLLSGSWVLDQGHYWSDQDRDRAWANLWRFAARGYAAQRARLRVEISFGFHTYFRLGDLIEVVYENLDARVSILPGDPHRNFFEVDTVAYAPNLAQQSWSTVYGLRQLTVYTAPTPDIPEVPPEVDD